MFTFYSTQLLFCTSKSRMVENTPVLVPWRANKPPERIRSHTRGFRNPPQPHMCIQDFIEGSREPCFINVMSWEKIALPLGPEDSIPLYGGMLVPHSPPSHAPVFAVMANPEVLRVKGKNAADPQETHALVLMMLDFVELMNRNRGLHFARHFQVLPDRDLAGELKNVWTAVQIKRAHDTATRASLQQLALQQQQQHHQLQRQQHQQHQRQHEEEQMQRYRRQQQQVHKEQQALMQKEQRYRQQQQQQRVEQQRYMDEMEEKYLEHRHHQRLLHEQQRDREKREQQQQKQQKQLKETLNQCSVVDSETLEACSFSPQEDENVLKLTQVELSSSSEADINHRPDSITLTDGESASAPATSPTSPPDRWIDACALRYREQEYLSTSASESDCTSDDGNATDVETDLDNDVEADNDAGRLMARVTVTVDTPSLANEPSDEAVGCDAGESDFKVLKNEENE